MSESTVLCSGRFLRKIFTFLLVPKSPITDHGKARKGSRFLKADAVPSVLFFFAPASLRAPVSNGMSVGRSRERHGLERKRAVDSRWPNDETTLCRKLAERERLQRNRSKVREGSADIERPTRDVGYVDQPAVCIMIQTSETYCRKSKAILFGLYSCR